MDGFVDGLTGLGLGGIIALAGVVWKIMPNLRRISHFLDDLMGEAARPGVPASPGILERLADVEVRRAPRVCGEETLKGCDKNHSSDD